MAAVAAPAGETIDTVGKGSLAGSAAPSTGLAFDKSTLPAATLGDEELPKMPGPRELAVYSVVVLVSHTAAAAACEYVFTSEGFRFGGFYAAAQFAMFCVLPLVKQFVLNGFKGHRQLLHSALLADDGRLGRLTCGAAMAVSHSAGHRAYVHVSFTTALLFKSAKVPAVMLGSGLLLPALPTGQHHHAPSDYAAALAMMVGLVIFGAAERFESPRFSLWGVLLLATNLVGGSLTSNLQQRVLQQKGHQKASVSSVEQLMVAQYGAATLIAGMQCFISGELSSAFLWFTQAGRTPLFAMVIDNLLTYVGLEAVMLITCNFDATRANVVCSSRKVCSFVLSYLLFPKPFGWMHAAGVALSLLGAGVLQLRASPRSHHT